MQQKNPETPPIPENPLRYRIAHFMAQLEPERRTKVRKRITKKANVSPSTITRWIHIRKKDTMDIPGAALYHWADLLNTTTDSLYNEDALI